ncbi:hypothetical protein [Caulobacter sp. CCG-8]|uniref:hypothetical protein n=1 Tax=Caulobacter sp. CCG-8 TaxID=3127958 RepID=UPI00307CF6A1
MNPTRAAMFWGSAIAAGMVFTLFVHGLFPSGRWVAATIGGAVALTSLGILISSKLKR